MSPEFDHYKRFQHFDTRVLKKAQSEINSKTELNFSYEKIRRNRSIHSIRFILSKKKLTQIVEKIEEKDNSDFKKLNFYGVSKTKAKELIAFDPLKVQEALKAIQNQASEVKNPAGWLVRYIEQGWKDSGRELLKNKKKQRQVDYQQEQERQESEQKETAKFKAYSRYENDQIIKIIERWQPDEEAKNWAVLKEQTWRSKKSSIFHKKGIEKWTTFLNRDIVIEYLKTHHGLELLTQVEFTGKE